MSSIHVLEKRFHRGWLPSSYGVINFGQAIMLENEVPDNWSIY